MRAQRVKLAHMLALLVGCSSPNTPTADAGDAGFNQAFDMRDALDSGDALDGSVGDAMSMDSAHSAGDGSVRSSVWMTSTVDDRLESNAGGQYVSIALNEADEPVIASLARGAGEVRVARGDGLAWDLETLGPAQGEYEVSIAMTASGEARVLYTMSDDPFVTGAYGVAAAIESAGAWSHSIAEEGHAVGGFLDLAVDADDRMHICYSINADVPSPLGIRYATYVDGTWRKMRVSESGTHENTCSIALDHSGQPRIGYYADATDDLMFAAWNGAEWSIDNIDSDGSVGQGVSLAIDSLDRPHMCYFDRSSNRVMYAYRAESTWERQVIAESVRYPFLANMEIALDSHDNPHVVYLDDRVPHYASMSSGIWMSSVIDEVGVTCSPSLHQS